MVLEMLAAPDAVRWPLRRHFIRLSIAWNPSDGEPHWG